MGSSKVWERVGGNAIGHQKAVDQGGGGGAQGAARSPKRVVRNFASESEPWDRIWMIPGISLALHWYRTGPIMVLHWLVLWCCTDSILGPTLEALGASQH